MYINYTTTQTILPLDLRSFLPHNHLVFTIEKVVNELDDTLFKGFYHVEGRAIFAKRKVDVEPVFGQIKAGLG